VNVDERLSALFSGLDARPGFNERLLARLHQEVVQDAQRADEARRQEQLRHRVARQTLSPWQEELGPWVNLETAGIVVLAGLTATSIWSADQIREYLPQVATALGLLLATVPLLGPMIRSQR
jgi:hypothetical protein